MLNASKCVECTKKKTANDSLIIFTVKGNGKLSEWASEKVKKNFDNFEECELKLPNDKLTRVLAIWFCIFYDFDLRMQSDVVKLLSEGYIKMICKEFEMLYKEWVVISWIRSVWVGVTTLTSCKWARAGLALIDTIS